ncbi:hypothetical protein ABT404_50220 [Streptomyces hyaluromycini]|uniref:Uncharacterized protein n=2 Tax=Streptomyces hyaluromycini TaxID=1377993 RepID=A0ABV1XES8_9ACTN
MKEIPTMTTAVHLSSQLPNPDRYPRTTAAVIAGLSPIPHVTAVYRTRRAAMAKEARG